MIVYVAAPYSKIKDKDKLMVDIGDFCGRYMINNPNEYAVTGLVHHYACINNPTLGTAYSFWADWCHEFLIKCDKMIVLMVDGWKESTGVQDEIIFCKSNYIPIVYATIDSYKQGTKND